MQGGISKGSALGQRGLSNYQKDQQIRAEIRAFMVVTFKSLSYQLFQQIVQKISTLSPAELEQKEDTPILKFKKKLDFVRDLLADLKQYLTEKQLPLTSKPFFYGIEYVDIDAQKVHLQVSGKGDEPPLIFEVGDTIPNLVTWKKYSKLLGDVLTNCHQSTAHNITSQMEQGRELFEDLKKELLPDLQANSAFQAFRAAKLLKFQEERKEKLFSEEPVDRVAGQSINSDTSSLASLMGQLASIDDQSRPPHDIQVSSLDSDCVSQFDSEEEYAMYSRYKADTEKDPVAYSYVPKNQFRAYLRTQDKATRKKRLTAARESLKSHISSQKEALADSGTKKSVGVAEALKAHMEQSRSVKKNLGIDQKHSRQTTLSHGKH